MNIDSKRLQSIIVLTKHYVRLEFQNTGRRFGNVASDLDVDFRNRRQIEEWTPKRPDINLSLTNICRTIDGNYCKLFIDLNLRATLKSLLTIFIILFPENGELEVTDSKRSYHRKWNIYELLQRQPESMAWRGPLFALGTKGGLLTKIWKQIVIWYNLECYTTYF